jgi:aminoglycoside 3-N-acetyltransferase
MFASSGQRAYSPAGPPFDSATLHYAECLADVPGKRVVRHRMPVLVAGRREWADVEAFDVSKGICDWGGGDYVEAIVQEYAAAGHGRAGLVGGARSYLFDARDLTDFGTVWMERAYR